MRQWSVDDDKFLLNFIVEQSETTRLPVNITQLCRDFVNNAKTGRTFVAAKSRVWKLLADIHVIDSIDEETKRKVIEALPNYQNPKNGLWREEEQNALFEFLIEKSGEKRLIKIMKLSKEFSLRTVRSVDGIKNKISELREKIHMVKGLDDGVKKDLMVLLRGNNDVERVWISKKSDWTAEEDVYLLKFLVEKSREAETPLNLIKLAGEYKMEMGSCRALSCIRTKMYHTRKKIDQFSHLDLYTKRRMMLALTPQQHTPLTVPGQSETMLDFLAETAANRKSPMPDFDFLISFMKFAELNYDAESSMYPRYQYAKKRIALSKKYDEKTKIRMMFVSNAPVSPEVLASFRKNAIVKLDQQKLIALYKSNDGSLFLERNPDDYAPPLKILKTENQSEN